MVAINIPYKKFLIIKRMLRNVIFLLLAGILCICKADNSSLETQAENMNIYDYKRESLFFEKMLQYANTYGLQASYITLYGISHEYDVNNTVALYDEIMAIVDHCHNNNESNTASEELLEEANIFFENIMRDYSVDDANQEIDNNFLTRKKCSSKKFNTLIAQRLRVCGNTVVNNLTVDGDLIACGGVKVCLDILATGTSEDIPNTLVLRDNQGSFASTTLTLTGDLVFAATNGNGITLQSGSPLDNFTLILPNSTGAMGQVLAASGTGSPDQLYWVNVNAIVTSTLNLFGDVTGTTASTVVSFVGGQTALSVANTVTTVQAATSLDIPNTLVRRDDLGNFNATTITLTGISVISFSLNEFGLSPIPFLQAPLNGNTVLGLQGGGQGLATSFNNTSVGYSAGTSLTTGTNNIYIGAYAGQFHQGNNSIFLGYTQTATGDGLIYIGNPSGVPSSTSTTIYGCINFPEVNPGTGYMASFDVATGQLVKASSSKKYKDNITSIDDELIESIYKLRPVEFVFKNAPTSKAFGLIAEEVDAICSDIVIYDEHHEPDSVNYLSVQMIALNALIKQSKIINTISSRCSELEAIVANQNTLIKDLDERIRLMNREQ